MSLEEKVPLVRIKKKDVEVFQGIFDMCILNKIDPDDEEYTSIMIELWNRVRETHRLRIVK